MDKNRGTYFMKNGSLLESQEFSYDLSEKNVYEVIRMIDGVPLFLEEHLGRMEDSLNLIQMHLSSSKEEIGNHILLLAEKNKITDGNVKILINNGTVQDIFVYFIPHFYPDEEYYRNGIRTMTLEISRSNPNAKVIDADYKKKVTGFLKEHNIYEALIVNHEKEITEGSKSNFFFIRKDTLCTPPLKDVLGGVTRKRILMIAEEMGIRVSETPLKMKDLHTVDAAFISGTSPKILPINTVDQHILHSSSNDMVQKLMAAYDEKIRSYTASRR